ncbi:MAG TPA: phosphoribosylformylglycinamidine cyclo-ligase, partial [Candidatus Thermoplasmatota archaeon]|nr:phosphoribosylformylglycinamidine cyclo-ligase [Candidatus Thermoplasmatota archaeon]
TDGVGSKVEIAQAMRKYDTVGIDCIAMNVNDCICVGAEPIAFVDYIATSDPDPEITQQIGVGLNEGAKQANVTLAGGETAVLPEIVNGWDLAGSCVGFVSKSRILDGSKVKPGDVIIGLPSTGLHSNGYTLARRILTSEGVDFGQSFPAGAYGTRTVGSVLLEPTRIYVRPILELRDTVDIHGLANITGGGLKNIPRVNPNVHYALTDPLPVPPAFIALQRWGGVSDQEMYQTFNMGMGFAVIVAASQAKESLRVLKAERPKVVGEVRKGRNVVHEPLKLEYASKTG